MAANCNIIRDGKGTPVAVEASNGKMSGLFVSLVDKFQNPELALKVYLTSRTKDFNNDVLTPIKQRGKVITKKVTSPIKKGGAELIFAPRVNPFTEEDTGQIELVLVKTNPEERGQGFAKQAINDFIDYADSVGKPTYLTVSPREIGVTEEGLIKLYQSFGYELLDTGFEMVRPVGNRTLPEVTEGLDENGEPTMDVLLNYIDNRSELIDEVDETFGVDVATNIDEEIDKIKQDLFRINSEELAKNERGEPAFQDAEMEEYRRLGKRRKELELYKEGKFSAYDAIREVVVKLDNLNKPFQKEVGTKFYPRKGTVLKGEKIRESEDLGGIYETDVSGYLFRGVSLEDYNRIKETGFIDTDLRGVISTEEGTNLAYSAGTAFNYLPDNAEGVVMVIDVSDKTGLFQIGADDYVRASKPIPFSDVKMVTTPSIGGAYTAIKGGKTSPVKIKTVVHKKEGLTKAEIAEYKNIMMGLRVMSTSDLSQKLKAGFMPEGYFNPTRESLAATKLYNAEEITDILTNSDLQDTIKSTFYKLTNLDGEVLNDGYFDENFLVVKNGNKNGIGKFELANPYLVEKEAVEVLGGINTRADFEDVLFNDDRVEMLRPIYLETQGTKEDLFMKFRDFKKLGVITYEEGQLSSKLNNTREYMEQVLTEPETTLLEENLNYLIQLEGIVFEENPDAVEKITKEVFKELTNIGMDVTNYEDIKQGKSVADLKNFLGSVFNFITTETPQAFDNMVGSYNEFFEVNSDFKFKNVPIAENISASNSFVLETGVSEIELFNKAGLIPIGPNVYKRISKSTPLDEVYEAVYTNTITNGYNNILSDEAVRPTGYDSDGTLNLSKIMDPSNKDAIIQDMKAYIQTQIAEIYVGGENINQEDLERYALMFNYINRSSDLNKFKVKPILDSEYSTFMSGIKNQGYLQTDFIADFNKKMLKEKAKDSVEFEEFYSNFEIDNVGIRLVNSDPVSLSKIGKYLEANQDLVNYMKLHKQGIDLDPQPIQDPVRDDTFLRNYYVNFPTQVKTFTGNYAELSKATILADTKQPFIRLNKGIFELITAVGSKGVYGRLNTQDGLFNVYDETLEPPTMDVDISEIYAIEANFDTEVELTNLYSEEEKDQIDNEHDNC